MSYGNDGPWKAWKAKTRLPTLSTVLGKTRKDSGFPTFPQLRRRVLYISGKLKQAGLTAGPKTVNSEGGPQ